MIIIFYCNYQLIELAAAINSEGMQSVLAQMTSVVQAVITQSEHEQVFTIHPEDRPILEQHPVVSGAHEVAITETLSVKTHAKSIQRGTIIRRSRRHRYGSRFCT